MERGYSLLPPFQLNALLEITRNYKRLLKITRNYKGLLEITILMNLAQYHRVTLHCADVGGALGAEDSSKLVIVLAATNYLGILEITRDY